MSKCSCTYSLDHSSTFYILLRTPLGIEDIRVITRKRSFEPGSKCRGEEKCWNSLVVGDQLNYIEYKLIDSLVEPVEFCQLNKIFG